MQKLSDLLGQLKGIFLPSTGKQGSPSLDGIYDPLGDQELFTPDRRGSMLKDTNGRLYYPSKNGYSRLKIPIIVQAPLLKTTTDDTVVSCSGGAYSGSGGVQSSKIICVYQNSGAPRVFSIYSDALKANLLFAQTIVDSTWTLLTTFDVEWGAVYIAWDAAAGATQKASTVVRSTYFVDQA